MSRNHWGVILTLTFILAALVAFSGVDSVGAESSDVKLAADSCTNLLTNSNMEANSGWLFGNSPVPPRYATDRYHSPYRSVLLGIVAGPNQRSYSSMTQYVSVPMGSYLRLRAHVYPLSQPYDGDDAQELIILNSQGNPIYRAWTSISNANAWQTLEFDLSQYMGMTIGVYFNVFNDGAGGVSAMYIDDVTLELCPGSSSPTVSPTPTSGFPTATPTPTNTPAFATSTPTSVVVTNTPTSTPTPNFITATPTQIVVTNTPTPTPTPNFVTATPTQIVLTNTPTPAFVTATPASVVATSTPAPPVIMPPPGVVCREAIINGSFETDEGWTFGKTDLRGRYIPYPSPVDGLRVVRLGNSDYSTANVRSYSSVSQNVFLDPHGSATATLSFWYYPLSDMEPGDNQELILLDARTGRTIKVLWRVNENYRTWLHKENIDLTHYLGRNVTIYFNVFNNGGAGRAAMYVDAVSLKLCGPAPTPMPVQPTTPAPEQTLLPTPAQPTATPTPSQQPTETPPQQPTVQPTAMPTALFVSPVDTATPVRTVPPAAVLPPTTPTPGPQQPLAAPTSMPTPEPPHTFWQIALSGLWYILIFFIIILILVIAFLMIRLLWGRTNESEEEEAETPPEADANVPAPPTEVIENADVDEKPPPPPEGE